jgi:hypothetical protein
MAETLIPSSGIDFGISGPTSRRDDDGNIVSYNPDTKSFTNPDLINWEKYLGNPDKTENNLIFYILIGLAVLLIAYMLFKR